MRILWAKSDFLHPTTKGGHIRTLEMLRRVRTRHELHYVAFSNDASGEGVKRSVEYCDHAYPIPHHLPTRRSPAFAVQLVQGMFSPLPLAVFRYQSQRMRSAIDDLLARYKFDIIVCDFIFPAPNLRALHGAVLFQHNVETMIWRRHAETAKNPVERLYFSGQARKMFRYESSVCQAARHVIGVSPADAESMRSLFGLKEVSAVATGVDVDYFTPNGVPRQPVADLIFVGSMDWLPNIDGVQYFHTSVLPLIRRERPNCSVAIVGRYPPREILALAQADPLIQVTGTVPDVRPFLHGARVSIVPLRIGGGTRMKIYESMAARVPVVSTSIGAEGLTIHPPDDIRIGDRPEDFAAHCLDLLARQEAWQRQSSLAWDLVSAHFGWDNIARQFEAILERQAGL